MTSKHKLNFIDLELEKFLLETDIRAFRKVGEAPKFLGQTEPGGKDYTELVFSIKKGGMDIGIPIKTVKDFKNKIKVIYKNKWIVRQFENEYNPIHNHSNCKISAVMHLKFPEKIDPPVKEHLEGLDGALIFSGMGDADEWCTNPVMKCDSSNVGWLHLFPSSLQHSVYPFKGKGERRSLSFNADIISQKHLDSIAEQEKLKYENEKAGI